MSQSQIINNQQPDQETLETENHEKDSSQLSEQYPPLSVQAVSNENSVREDGQEPTLSEEFKLNLDISEPSNICRIEGHQMQPLEFICLTKSCSNPGKSLQLICGVCLSEEHYGHQIKLVNLVGHQLNKIKDNTESTRETFQKIENLRLKGNQYFQKLLQLIQESQKQFNFRIDQISDIVQKEDDQIIEKLEEGIQSLTVKPIAENVGEVLDSVGEIIVVNPINGSLSLKRPNYSETAGRNSNQIFMFNTRMEKKIEALEGDFQIYLDDLQSTRSPQRVSQIPLDVGVDNQNKISYNHNQNTMHNVNFNKQQTSNSGGNSNNQNNNIQPNPILFNPNYNHGESFIKQSLNQNVSGGSIRYEDINTKSVNQATPINSYNPVNSFTFESSLQNVEFQSSFHSGSINNNNNHNNNTNNNSNFIPVSNQNAIRFNNSINSNNPQPQNQNNTFSSQNAKVYK